MKEITTDFAIEYLLDDCGDCSENKDGECMTQSHCFEVKQMAIKALRMMNKAENGKMLICPECGLDVHSDYKKCPRCGARMGSEDRMSKETTCENCIYANACIMYEPKMKRCKDYKESENKE